MRHSLAHTFAFDPCAVTRLQATAGEREQERASEHNPRGSASDGRGARPVPRRIGSRRKQRAPQAAARGVQCENRRSDNEPTSRPRAPTRL